MFGWEFPPFNSGGLGVACEGLVRGLAMQGARITFVLPKEMPCRSDFCRFTFGDSMDDFVKIKKIDSLLSPYIDSKDYKDSYSMLTLAKKRRMLYRPDLIGEVFRYARCAEEIAKREDFDVIHCHDWLSFPAGLAAKKVSGKPLVFHVHATEVDRVGKDSVNRDIFLIEKEGFEKADAVIAVSDYTKRVITENYGIDEKKISVVPNAIDHDAYAARFCDFAIKKSGKKVVLFVGRLTYQKGPDYFLRAAKRVADTDPNVMFVYSGAGDMEQWLIEEAAHLGISDKVFFTGFLRGEELKRVYRMADLYVMSSVSEPFGLTSLESIASGTPILVSKTSGVSEMLSHCLKVDFWDIDQMASKILAVMKYPELRETLRDNGSGEVTKFSWSDSAEKCLNIYQKVLVA